MTEDTETKRYQSLSEFYPFYLSEHSNVVNRRLHFAGTSCAIILLASMLLSGNAWFFLLALFGAYGFAWVGHFFFEHNKPATFQYPRYSLICDFIMYKDIWLGRVSLVN